MEDLARGSELHRLNICALDLFLELDVGLVVIASEVEAHIHRIEVVVLALVSPCDHQHWSLGVHNLFKLLVRSQCLNFILKEVIGQIDGECFNFFLLGREVEGNNDLRHLRAWSLLLVKRLRYLVAIVVRLAIWIGIKLEVEAFRHDVSVPANKDIVIMGA